MALSDAAIRSAKPKEKPYKMADSGGLYLSVEPSGGRLWRLKYRYLGKERKLALGRYPEVSLASARALRDEAKLELANGKDPGLEKQRRRAQAQESAGNTFSVVAEDYFDKRTRDGASAWSTSTLIKNQWLLALLEPDLGRIPVSDIKPIEVLNAVRKIEARGNHETARRALQLCGGIFRYAVATARLASDPTRDLRGALVSPKVRHRAAILDPVQLGELLRAMEGYKGHYGTLYALRLAPHVFVRPGELRQALWAEIDFDSAVWSIPAARTKMRKPHHVPLSRQAMEILRELRQLSATGDGYVFPSVRTPKRPMSDNTLNAALRRLGFSSDEVTTHGFRATASTLLNESGLWSADAIERALAHGDTDKVRAAYHRGAHWDERVKMAQWWSDYLDELAGLGKSEEGAAER